MASSVARLPDIGPIRFRKGRGLAAALLFSILAYASGGLAADADAVARGKYLFDAAGCYNCHTDIEGKGSPLAGGRRLKTPFGDFITPNITADATNGIGKWSDADFIRALREGKAPDGSPYYPAFPYPSYTGMTDRDMLDIKAYLMSAPPASTPNRPHELKFPYSLRLLNHGWQMLFLKKGPPQPTAGKDQAYNRGAYLTEAVAHCGECHTGRNFLGALDQDKRLAGSATGPDGKSVPNITPHDSTNVGKMSAADLASLIKDGMTPDGDFLGGAMEEVINNGTSKLTDADRAAIATYIKALPGLPSAGK